MSQDPPTNKRKPESNEEELQSLLKRPKTITKTLGQIRIGTRQYKRDGTYTDPSFPGFIPIVCLTASTKYGSLGPYIVKVTEEGPDKGALIENVWHSKKVLPKIPAAFEKISRYNPTVAWQYPAVNNLVNNTTGEVDMKQWIEWSTKLCHNPYPIRYPFSFNPAVRATTLGIIPLEKIAAYRLNPESVKINAKTDLLGIADGRKQVYFYYYMSAVKLQPQYQELKQLLEQGKNLLIIDVDGPRQESLPYYIEKYKVADNWIENHTVLWTLENARIFLNDPKHSCGHTFGLPACLFGLEREFLT